MKENIIRLKKIVLDFINVGQVIREPVSEKNDFLRQVREAHREWQIALNNYNFCEDPDFIDYSICNIEAKEKHYMYLIKRARKENFALDLKICDVTYIKSVDN